MPLTLASTHHETVFMAHFLVQHSQSPIEYSSCFTLHVHVSVNYQKCNVVYLHSNINKVDKAECLQKVI